MTRNRLIEVEQPEISTALVDNVRLEKTDETVNVRFTVDSAGYASAALTEPDAYPWTRKRRKACNPP